MNVKRPLSDQGRLLLVHTIWCTLGIKLLVGERRLGDGNGIGSGGGGCDDDKDNEEEEGEEAIECTLCDDGFNSDVVADKDIDNNCGDNIEDDDELNDDASAVVAVTADGEDDDDEEEEKEGGCDDKPNVSEEDANEDDADDEAEANVDSALTSRCRLSP